IPVPGAVLHVDPLAAVAVEEDGARLFAEIAYGDVGSEAVMLGDGLADLAEPALGGGHAAPRQDRALVDGERVVRQHEVRIDLEPRTETGAVGAGAVGRVEAEVARSGLLERSAVDRARIFLAVRPVGFLRRRVRQVE